MIYGVAEQPNSTQQRRSLRSLLYTKVIPRSQRTANVSRDTTTTAHVQPTPRQDFRRPVTTLKLLAVSQPPLVIFPRVREVGFWLMNSPSVIIFV